MGRSGPVFNANSKKPSGRGESTTATGATRCHAQGLSEHGKDCADGKG